MLAQGPPREFPSSGCYRTCLSYQLLYSLFFRREGSEEGEAVLDSGWIVARRMTGSAASTPQWVSGGFEFLFKIAKDEKDDEGTK